MTAVMLLETERGAVDIREFCVVVVGGDSGISDPVIVNGPRGVEEPSGHESAFSSVHIETDMSMIQILLVNTRTPYLILPGR